jgi:hypothetical protein
VNATVTNLKSTVIVIVMQSPSSLMIALIKITVRPTIAMHWMRFVNLFMMPFNRLNKASVYCRLLYLASNVRD